MFNIDNIVIKKFENKFSKDFYFLNKSWIEESWDLEESDKSDLLNPDKIIQGGGQVFFAINNHEVIGTVAMIKNSDKIYELAKMTVKSSFRGKGIANLLMDECIEFAFKKMLLKFFLFLMIR
jgi:predicted N-acetyltransferase YhbS